MKKIQKKRMFNQCFNRRRSGLICKNFSFDFLGLNNDDFQNYFANGLVGFKQFKTLSCRLVFYIKLKHSSSSTSRLYLTVIHRRRSDIGE